MKKNFRFAFVGAIALLGAVGISSCSSSSDEVINNPDYNPESEMVKTQFAISLSDNVVKTRMSSNNTQADGSSANFRGLQDILLIPFKSTTASDANINGKVIGLTEESAAANAALTNDKNYLYNNIDVKTQTNYFVFYAVAKPGTSTGFQVGRLTPTLPAANATSVSLATYGFSPVPIITSSEYTDNQTQANNVRDNLVAKLNQVLHVTGWKSSEYPALITLYNQFASLRVGSSEGVQKALQNLYTKADAVSGDGATLAANIKTAIKNELTSPKGDGVTITESGGTLTFGAGYNNYPTVIGLPNGSARLSFTAGATASDEDSFSAATTSDILLSTTNTTAPDKFVYPADLRYFQQTTIRTAKSAFLSTNLSTAWSTIVANAVYDGTAVAGDTRSIVLVNPIQYGVGRLETSIAAMSATDYYDRLGAKVTIPDGGFTLTGVIIGGQKPVDWKFNTKTGTDVYTIYDSDVTGVSASSTASGTNHTLALETTADEAVQVALQFVNNGTVAFEGADGTIYPGQTFYMIGNLNPATGGNGTQPTGGGSINQVFLQDYVTKATFTIGAGYASTDTNFNATTGNTTGFGAALSGLPDLTTVSMEFGLSVNLQWQAGLSFSVNL